MNLIEIILISISLAADAFAVSVCKGLSIKKISIKKILIVGAYFGIFQGIMPIIGYFLGNTFENIITNIDHWLIFVLLVTIGANMIRESFSNEIKETNDLINIKTMLPLAIATSIDALAIGITFAFLKVNVILSCTLISIITFTLSSLGVYLGNRVGKKYEHKAEFIGGFILIILGVKILLEHLNSF